MFVFSSILIVATWFVSRIAWDHLLRRSWRHDPRRRRLRFTCITATGCALALAGFGSVVGALYGAIAGVVAAAALAPAYVFIAIVLRMLLRSFDVDVDGTEDAPAA